VFQGQQVVVLGQARVDGGVREYYEGKKDWIEAGLPVEREAVPVTR
jgi:hypothetical protein